MFHYHSAGPTQSSVSRILQHITDVLNNKAAQEIRMPSTPQELRATAQAFSEISNLPRVIGAIDGKLWHRLARKKIQYHIIVFSQVELIGKVYIVVETIIRIAISVAKVMLGALIVVVRGRGPHLPWHQTLTLCWIGTLLPQDTGPLCHLRCHCLPSPGFPRTSRYPFLDQPESVW